MSEAFILSLDTGDTPISTKFWKLASYAPYMLVWWYPERGVVYGFRFRPSGVNDLIISIQWLSLHLRWLVSSLWIFSIIMIARCFIEWSNRVKCWATGLSIWWWLMFDRWPVRRTRSAFSISPMYWMVHFLHSIRYTTFLVRQSVVAFTPNLWPVVLLLNIVPIFICSHNLQGGCWHWLFPL